MIHIRENYSDYYGPKGYNILEGDFIMAGYVIGSEAHKANDARRAMLIGRTKDLRDKGLGAIEIARELGLCESTVRAYMHIINQAESNGMK